MELQHVRRKQLVSTQITEWAIGIKWDNRAGYWQWDGWFPCLPMLSMIAWAFLVGPFFFTCRCSPLPSKQFTQPRFDARWVCSISFTHLLWQWTRVAQLMYSVLLCNVPFWMNIFHTANLSRAQLLSCNQQLGLGRSLRAAAFEVRSAYSDLTRLTPPNSV